MRFVYPQDCTGRTANGESSVAYLTLSIDGTPDDGRKAIDEAVRRQGGRAIWRVHSNLGRSYALLELPESYDQRAIRAASAGVLYETPVIAMAVSPTVPQALPGILDALGGLGKPAGVLACRSVAGAAVIEWDPNVSPVGLVLGLIDVELHRFAAGRTVDLLAPLPPSSVAKIAAEGLQAPQIEPSRVLEMVIDDV